jgi:hypothetical protein
MPATDADRVAFWVRLHERLAKLSNRIDPEAQGKILDDAHARVPMVTVDERRALQLDAARTDAQQRAALRVMLAEQADGHEKTAAHATAKPAASKAVAEIVDRDAKRAQEHVEAIERGESVEGAADKPDDLRAELRALGATDADLRHCLLLASVPKERWPEFLDLVHRSSQRSFRRLSARAARAILPKHGEG